MYAVCNLKVCRKKFSTSVETMSIYFPPKVHINNQVYSDTNESRYTKLLKC